MGDILDEFKQFLDACPGRDGTGLSATNKKDILGPVTRLVAGTGLCRANEKEPSFMVGEAVSLATVDVDQLKIKAAAWVPKGEDKSNGWRWNHPLEYVRKFQCARRGEPGPEPKPKKTQPRKRAVATTDSGKARVVKPRLADAAKVEVKAACAVTESGGVTLCITVSSQDPELKSLIESMKRLSNEQSKDEQELAMIEQKEKKLAIRKAESHARMEHRAPRIARLQAAIAAFNA